MSEEKHVQKFPPPDPDSDDDAERAQV